MLFNLRNKRRKEPTLFHLAQKKRKKKKTTEERKYRDMRRGEWGGNRGRGGEVPGKRYRPVHCFCYQKRERPVLTHAGKRSTRERKRGKGM